MKILSLFILPVLFSCSQIERHKARLQCVDKLEMIHYTDTGITVHYYQEERVLNIYRELINAKQEDILRTKPNGLIRFYCKDKPVFTATMFPTGCKYVFDEDTFSTRLTYRSGQFWIGL